MMVTTNNVMTGNSCDDNDLGKSQYCSAGEMDTIFSSSSFNLMSLNIRSLSSSYDSLSDLLSTAKTKFSIITLQEVWSVARSYDLPDFHPLQCQTRDQNEPLNANCGGGVGIYINRNLDFEPLPQLNKFVKGVYESIWVLVSARDGGMMQKWIIASIYRPDSPPLANPDRALEIHNSILKDISLDKRLSQCKLFVTSDFNLDLNLSLTSPRISNYVADQASFGLTSMISISAHPTPTSSKLIDHIFSNVPSSSIRTGVLIEHLSDHLPIILADLSAGKVDSMPSQPHRDMSNQNVNSYLNLLKNIEFVVEENNPKGSFDTFFRLITEAAELSFPPKPPRKKRIRKGNPWITKGLAKSSATKKKLFSTKLKNPTPANRLAFSTYSKIFVKCLRAAKKIYYLSCFREAVSNSKKTWTLINEVAGRSRSSASLPSTFTIPPRPNSSPSSSPSTTTDPQTIANGFNNFFGTIGPELASKIDQKKHADNHFSSFLGPKPDERFKLFPVTISRLIAIVEKLKNKSSCGSDLMSNILIKKSIYILAKPLQSLINLSFTSGYVPDQITIAKVIPLHKEGDKGSFNNYRPIAIISTIGKVIEKVVHQQLTDFLTSQHILTPSQFGFRSGHGVEHPLLLFSDRVRKSLSKKCHNISIFIDLKKAFDTVNFDLLLAKLHHYGVTGVALLWFKNYLARSQYVVTGDVISDVFSMLCGIPQGTVLGPLLFLIFVNDFAFATTLLSLLFADDCTLQGEGEDILLLITLVNAQLLVAERWFAANLLTLNIKKTKYIIFHHSPPSPLSTIPPLTIGQDILDRVGTNLRETSVRFLGVLIDDKMLFKEHIANLKKKLSKGLYALASSKFNTPLSVRRTIYFSLFESDLRFGALLYGCASIKDLKDISILQKKAVRHVVSANFLAHTDPIFQSQGILKLEDLISLERSILVHKYRNGKLPEAFSNTLIPFLSPIDISDMTRRQDPLCYTPLTNDHPFVPRSPTALLISSWNLVPYSSKIIGCRKAFKTDLTASYLKSYSSVCSELSCRSCGV